MRNLKVFIAYNGAEYHGFQRQDNAVTVQEIVENSIGKLLKIPAPVIYGCSRTDTGVHARQFCFNVHIDSRIPCEGFLKGMNTLLPPDIAVLSCEEAPEDFHARYCTRGKEYVYLIANTPQRDVFQQKLAYHYPYELDIGKMNEAAQLLVGEQIGVAPQRTRDPHIRLQRQPRVTARRTLHRTRRTEFRNKPVLIGWVAHPRLCK